MPTITINRRPGYLTTRLPWFVLQALEHIKVVAKKVNDKYVVSKSTIVAAVKCRKNGFVDAADFIEKMQDENIEVDPNDCTLESN